MEIYENVLIGNFLFSLGLEIGLRHKQGQVIPILPLQTQQTEWDQSLADVVLGAPGMLRIVEFKGKWNKSTKELVKLWTLRKALRARSKVNLEFLTVVSRSIHWYVEIPKEFTTNIRVVPYLDFQTGSADFIEYATYISGLATRAAEPVINEEESAGYWEYLNVLGLSRGRSRAGALLLVLQGDGSVLYHPVESFLDIILPDNLVNEHKRALAEKAEVKLMQRCSAAANEIAAYKKDSAVSEQQAQNIRTGPSMRL